jgi:hypothetical protein
MAVKLYVGTEETLFNTLEAREGRAGSATSSGTDAALSISI